MSVLFDLAVIAIFVFCIFMGYKKGLINVILKVCSFILALLLSLILFTPISNLVIDNTSFHSDIKNSIIEFVNGRNSDSSTDDTNLDSENNTSIIEKYINSSIETATKKAVDNATQVAADSIATNIIRIVVLIILFLVFRIILIFVKFIFNSVAELPVIKQFNESGGIIYGVLKALLIIYIIFALIALFSKGNSVEQAITNSYIASLFYNNNLLFILFLK